LAEQGLVGENAIKIEVTPVLESEDPLAKIKAQLQAEPIPITVEPTVNPQGEGGTPTEGGAPGHIPDTLETGEVTVQKVRVDYEEGEKPEGVEASDGTGKINYSVGDIEIPTNVVATGTINYDLGTV
jgi:hypothetical protein